MVGCVFVDVSVCIRRIVCVLSFVVPLLFVWCWRFGVGCCLLVVSCCALFVVCGLSRDVFVLFVCGLLRIDYVGLFVQCCLIVVFVVVCGALFLVCCLWCVVRCLLSSPLLPSCFVNMLVSRVC